jgi:opacity protein-like surface antigen
MSRLSRFIVFATAVVSVLGALSGSASAVVWQNDGDTSFTATGGQGTLSGAFGAYSCTGSDGSGTAPATATSLTYMISGTITFTGCTAAGSPGVFECGYAMTTTSMVASTATGNMDLTCGFYISNTRLCHVESVLHAEYTNPTLTTTGRLTTTTGIWLLTGASCPLAGVDHVTSLTFRVTGPNRGPFVTRNA